MCLSVDKEFFIKFKVFPYTKEVKKILFTQNFVAETVPPFSCKKTKMKRRVEFRMFKDPSSAGRGNCTTTVRPFIAKHDHKKHGNTRFMFQIVFFFIMILSYTIGPICWSWQSTTSPPLPCIIIASAGTRDRVRSVKRSSPADDANFAHTHCPEKGNGGKGHREWLLECNS